MHPLAVFDNVENITNLEWYPVAVLALLLFLFSPAVAVYVALTIRERRARP